MRSKGLIRRLKKARNNGPALYVRLGVEVDSLPFENLTLPQVIEQVLGEADQPLSQTELVVKMLSQGYETAMDKKMLRNALGVELRKDCRFLAEGDMWHVDMR